MIHFRCLHDCGAQIVLKLRKRAGRLAAQVEMDHRMDLPVVVEVCDGEAVEEVAFCEEDGLEGGDQERLAEAAGTGKEILALAGRDELVDLRCFSM